MAWDDERADVIKRLGSTESEIKVLREAQYSQKLETQQCVTAAMGTVRQELAEEKRNLVASNNEVRGDVVDLQVAVTGNSTRLNIIIGIAGFIALAIISLSIAMLPYLMDKPGEQRATRVSMPFDQRMQMIIDVISHMDANNPALWTSTGMPKVDHIERELTSRLGYPVQVSDIERSRAAVIVGASPQ